MSWQLWVYRSVYMPSGRLRKRRGLMHFARGYNWSMSVYKDDSLVRSLNRQLREEEECGGPPAPLFVSCAEPQCILAATRLVKCRGVSTH